MFNLHPNSQARRRQPRMPEKTLVMQENATLSPPQHLVLPSTLRTGTTCGFWLYMTGAMHHAVCERPRTPLPRTRVNKKMRDGSGAIGQRLVTL
jgi:hypothetical protein